MNVKHLVNLLDGAVSEIDYALNSNKSKEAKEHYLNNAKYCIETVKGYINVEESDTRVVIAMEVQGISLNGLQILRDETDDPRIFESRESAVEFIHSVYGGALSEYDFMKHFRFLDYHAYLRGKHEDVLKEVK